MAVEGDRPEHGPDGFPVWPVDDPDIEVPAAPATGAATRAIDAGTAARTPPRARGTRGRATPTSGRRSRAQRMLAPIALAVLVLVAPLGVRAVLPASSEIPGRPVAVPAAPTAASPTRPGVERVIALDGHPLLGDGAALPPTTCELPRFRRETNELRSYYHALVECLDASWHDVLVARGMPHGSPSLNLAEHPGQTGCGDPAERETDFTALYCPSDLTLYLPVDRLRDVDGGAASSHLAIVAHEYAHHVQELSGLLQAAAEEFDRVGVQTDAGKLVSRRIELQANCFAGLFLASVAGRGGVTRRLAEQAVADFANGGLHDTHGTARNQAAWARRGFDAGVTTACDTWAVPPADVA